MSDTAAPDIKAKHRAMWASATTHPSPPTSSPPSGPTLVDGHRHQVRRPRARHRRRFGQRLDPRRTDRRRRRRLRPDARAARDGPQPGRVRRAHARVARGRRRGAALRRRRVRCRDLLRRHHVRAAPPGERRRARTRAATRRIDRAHQLDSRGLHRPDVRRHEAVRSAAAARCPAGTAVGQRGARRRAVRRPGDRRRRHAAEDHGRHVQHGRGVPRLLQGLATARRSRSTRSSATTPSARRRWIASSPSSPRVTTSAAARWSGSTCCTPRASGSPAGQERWSAR